VARGNPVPPVAFPDAYDHAERVQGKAESTVVRVRDRGKNKHDPSKGVEQRARVKAATTRNEHSEESDWPNGDASGTEGLGEPEAWKKCSALGRLQALLGYSAAACEDALGGHRTTSPVNAPCAQCVARQR
jgi:hypothetical protein